MELFNRKEVKCSSLTVSIILLVYKHNILLLGPFCYLLLTVEKAKKNCQQIKTQQSHSLCGALSYHKSIRIGKNLWSGITLGANF